VDHLGVPSQRGHQCLSLLGGNGLMGCSTPGDNTHLPGGEFPLAVPKGEQHEGGEDGNPDVDLQARRLLE